MQDSIDDLINSIYTKTDVSDYVNLILRRFHTLTFYLIEPYFPQKEGADSLKIPVTDNYTLHDHGGHLIVSANDIYDTPLFSCAEFLLAAEKAIEMLVGAAVQEIAILGDYRAKLLVWDTLDKLNHSAEYSKNPLKLINFSPPEAFGMTRESVLRFLKDSGMAPKVLHKDLGLSLL